MQPLSSFKDNLGIAILLCGGAGVGKTALALRLFPKSYVFIADLNFKSGVDYLRRLNQTSNIVGIDTASPDENGKIVPPQLRYDRMLKCLTVAIASPNIDAIILDSGTQINEILKSKITGATTEVTYFQGTNTIKLWGDFLVAWKSIIWQFRQSGKKLILVCHERKEQDASDGIYKYELDLDGSIRSKLPALMSDVWRCEIAENLGVHTWNVRTLGNIRQEHLKRSTMFSDLKPVVLQDELVKFLHTRNAVGGATPTNTTTTKQN